MASTFLKEMMARSEVTDTEAKILATADVTSAEDLDALLRAFPSLASQGIGRQRLASAVASQLKAAYSAVTGIGEAPPHPAPLGALPPPSATFKPGDRVPLTAMAPMGGVAAPPPPIDLRLPHWPVRDQGQRGTCVAFGATACSEHLTQVPDLSEQFLYWAIKDHSNDPYHGSDGTWLEYARDMLAQDGICTEPLCPYVGTPVVPVSGAIPSAAAKADAAARKITATTWAQTPANAASGLLQLLQRGRPVGICLPVFGDPSTPNGPTNWTTNVGWAYGRVLNPPPTAQVVGGHCVCVTGFAPDPNEPFGGYFIIRNSWSIAWANRAPAPGNSHSPEPGYGEVSAYYVNAYCWEILQL